MLLEMTLPLHLRTLALAQTTTLWEMVPSGLGCMSLCCLGESQIFARLLLVHLGVVAEAEEQQVAPEARSPL